MIDSLVLTVQILKDAFYINIKSRSKLFKFTSFNFDELYFTCYKLLEFTLANFDETYQHEPFH